MHRLARLMTSALAALSLCCCDQLETAPQTATDDYMSGRRDGCIVAGGQWDDTNSTCKERASWLMVQDAKAVGFVFDDAIDEACPGDAFWSGTMTLSDVDGATLWFTDRPYRHAYTQSTALFASGFAEQFALQSGGNPNAVVTWDDVSHGADRHVVVTLRAVNKVSPRFDADAKTLTYKVCGLKIDDPGSLAPLPDSQQVVPDPAPSAEGKFTLFIDSGRQALLRFPCTFCAANVVCF